LEAEPTIPSTWGSGQVSALVRNCLGSLSGLFILSCHLIKDVVLEGIVVREPWKFMDDLFFQLVIYRDSDLPAKKLDLGREGTISEGPELIED